MEEMEAGKTAAVGDLEERLADTQRDLEESQQRAEELAEAVERLERWERETREGREGDEGELETLQESVESLTHQLSSALVDLEKLQKQ